MLALWRFISAHSRTVEGDPGIVVCDATLQGVLGLSEADPRLHLSTVNQFIDRFVQPTQPINIDYELQLQV